MRVVWIALLTTAVCACDGGGGDPGAAGDGGRLDGGGAGGEGGGGSGGAPADGGAADACVPLACPADACGALEDGCGGVLDCGICSCDPAQFGADCPPRPCAIPLGCEGGACQYTPITCGGQVCRCLDGDCPDEAPRPCGLNACPTDYCDPTPEVVAGRIVFGNACVGPPEQPCGLCDLGRERCDAVAGVPVCTDITLPGLDPAEVECDSTRDGSTFVYVDADYDDGPGDGSREAPFRSLNEAIAAAAARNVRGVVIGG
ncbi:MAG: hypothetical protein KC613_25400, partial [Myxococcales bacterium]|nr:hypothetical protein [Myxococcales bacterium]